MYKKRRFYIFLIILFLSNLSLCHMAAQGTEETEDTHAHSSSFKWKGIDVSTVIDNSQYDPLPGENHKPPMNKYPFNKGKKFFLYNVGTGRFVIEGGNFGMEGRLFHETFGRPLYLFSDGFIISGIKEENDNQKFIFGCNVPGVLHSNGSWDNWGTYSFTIMMDADRAKRKKVNNKYQGWKFDRIKGETGDTYTYYMYEEKSDKNYFLGAAYGECGADAWKGVGTLVHMDDDRATWTSIDPRRVQDKYEVYGDMITLDELYQWRLVPEDEFINMLDNEEIGLNPSVSVFIKDRDFTRNSQEFSQSWLVEEKNGVDYSEYNRLGYTFGSIDNTVNQQTKFNDDKPWNEPIRVKHIFNGNGTVNYDDNKPGVIVNYGWKNAKYGFLTFEGVGRTYTEVKVPRAGWYLVQCYGFVQSDMDHDAYLFARLVRSDGTSPTGAEAKINLKTVPAGTYTGKNVKDSCLNVGKELTKNGENYKNAVWICVTEEQFNDPVNPLKKLQIGVGKDEATQSKATKNGRKNYYYDTDWVCVDDFRMSYLGLRPAFFYEDEEDLNYLKPDLSVNKQYRGASPTGQYAGAICIERSLKTNEWNTFSFPMPLTGEQIRNAFGEDAKLAEIHSVGEFSRHSNVIDFQTKTLFGNSSEEDPDFIDYAVEPGHFYLLKPTKLPFTGVDPRGKDVEYYELGRKYFSVREEDANPDTYNHTHLSTSDYKGSQIVSKSYDGSNSITATVNYIQTPGFNSFTVSSAMGIYAPKGSYAVSVSTTTNKTTIFHLNKDTRIKGFRGWMELNSELGSEAKELSMEIYGMFDEVPVSIATGAELPRIQILDNDEAVYDLTGRKVGTLGKNLPKGMYIVKGKKFFVK